MRFRSVVDVAAWRMCVGCGACVPACAEGRVRLVDVVDDGLRPLVDHPESCGSCRDCLRVCPGWEIDHRALRRAPGAERSLLRTCGPVLEVWEGYASDPDIRRQGSSGGMITALALHAVERGGMHGTLHIGADERRPLASRAHLSRTRGELLARAGSRYAPAAPCVGLTLIAEAPAPCVFAGKPCDVTGLARSIALRPGLGRKVGLTLSFFCAGTPATQGTLDLLARRGVNPESVGALRYRGDGWPGMFRADAAGDGAPLARLSYAESWGFLQAYRPYRCYLCPDGTGEDADIACGDPWYRAPREGEAGASLVLVRTERGRRALAAAREAGYVRAERAAPSLVTAAQRRLLEKRRALWGRLLTMRALGVPAPRLRGFSLFANWLGLPAREKLRSTAGAGRRILSRGYRRPANRTFVDYEEHGEDLKILKETKPIPIEHIAWDCLSIEAQGYGVIQKVGPLKTDSKQTKRDFYKGFLAAYEKYRQKEHRKHQNFARRFIKDPDSIDW